MRGATGEYEREPVRDRAVAGARHPLEPAAIHHRHTTATVLDEPPGLQLPRDHRYRLPTRAEHVGEEFLRDREVARLDPVVDHEHPPSAPLEGRVSDVARGAQRYLIEQRLGEPGDRQTGMVHFLLLNRAVYRRARARPVRAPAPGPG